MDQVWTPHFRHVYLCEEYQELRKLAQTELRGLILVPTTLDVWEGKLFIRTRKSVWVGYCHTFEVHFPESYPQELPVICITSTVPPNPRVAPDGTIELPCEVLQSPLQNSVLVACMRHMMNLFCTDSGIGTRRDTLNAIAQERSRRQELLSKIPPRVLGLLSSVVDTFRKAEQNVVLWFDREGGALLRQKN